MTTEEDMMENTAAPGDALLTNPHTGTPRDYRDVESDPAGLLIVKPGEPIRAYAAPSDVEQQARELLARAYDEGECPENAAYIRSGGGGECEFAIRAITAALTQQGR